MKPSTAYRCGKVKWIDQRSAQNAAKHSTYGHMDAYKCGRCGFWHIGHPNLAYQNNKRLSKQSRCESAKNHEFYISLVNKIIEQIIPNHQKWERDVIKEYTDAGFILTPLC